MTPEERFTKIENALQTITEQQARTAEQQTRTDALLTRTAEQSARHEARFSDIGNRIDALTSASHDLIRVSRQLIRSQRLMEQLLESQSRRLDRLDDESRN